MTQSVQTGAVCWGRKGEINVNCAILIVEDEGKLREVLCDYFRSKGEIPSQAADGLQALAMIEEGAFDAVLLDIMIPGLDGRAVCRAIRRHSDVPVIFLTALSDEEDKLLGYELGADDYVTKPFTLSVLYAKTMALIRRSRGTMRQGDVLTAGELTLQLSAQKVLSAGREVALTPKEFSLLRCLMQNKNVVMSREQLLVKCWGYDYEGEARAVDTHIKRLREKLGGAGGCIKTVIKAGYKIEG